MFELQYKTSALNIKWKLLLMISHDCCSHARTELQKMLLVFAQFHTS